MGAEKLIRKLDQKSTTIPAIGVSKSQPCTPEDVLKTTFGYDKFRTSQRDVIECLLNGMNVLAVMPTGAGKSLCFQIPALVLGGLTIVVSPLVALMEDQVASLKEYGVAAECIHASKSRQDNIAIWHKVMAEQVSLLYMAPERLMTPRMTQALSKRPLNLIAVDEAHCMSRWGASFRPEYAALNNLGNLFPNVPIVALTATADEATRKDIQDNLFTGSYKTFVSGFDRPNIKIAATRKVNAKDQLIEFIEQYRGQSGIIYCLSRKKAEKTAELLKMNGFDALPYHAGLDANTRADHQNRFLTEAGIVMTATIAFGMGIDKSDVRYVFHLDMPATMESYYQEIGRAGRDGQPAETLMLYGPGDIRLRRQFMEAEFPDPERALQEEKRLQALINYTHATSCRRQVLLSYFGEDANPCGNCDRCDNPVNSVDASDDAALVIATIRDTGERYGQVHLVDVLLGEFTEKVRRAKHDEEACFGMGRHKNRNAWRGLIRQMIEQSFLEIDTGGYGSILITNKGDGLSRGKEVFEFYNDPLEKVVIPISQNAPKRKTGFGNTNIKEAFSNRDLEILVDLKSKRMELAKNRNVPPYVIFSDQTLEDMVRQKPDCLEDFSTIRGVGVKKLQSLANDFLKVLQKFD